MLKKLLVLSLVGLIPIAGKAQLIDPSPYIANAQEDANYLAGGYLAPFGKSLSSSLNNGWYRSASVLEPWGFSISVAPTALRIPDDEDEFTIRNSEMSELELVQGEQAQSPTAFGSTEEGPLLRSRSAGPLGGSYTFNAPGGADSDYFVGAGINAAVGLPLGTNLHARFLPKMTFTLEEQEIQLSSWGLGARHSLSQYVAEETEFDLAVFGAFSQLSMNMPLSTGEDHEVDISSNSYTVRGIVSKTFLGILTPYIAMGVNGGGSTININGTYSYSSGAELVFGETSVKDPVQVDTETTGGFVANAGISAEFFNVIFLDVNYTLADYNALTAALGFQVEL